MLQGIVRIVRGTYVVMGWICVAVGVLGIFLPLLPTVPFLILASLLFSKGSTKFQSWLMHHPQLGPPVTDWQEHGVIRRRAKVTSTIALFASWCFSVWFLHDRPVLLWIPTICIAGAGIFIWTRKSVKETA